MSPAEIAKHKKYSAIFAGIATVVVMVATGGKSVNVVAIALCFLALAALIFLVGFVAGSKNLKRSSAIGMGFSILLIFGNMMFPNM